MVQRGVSPIDTKDLKSNIECALGIIAQQVEVLPSLVTDCKKPLHRNRLFWGQGIGYF